MPRPTLKNPGRGDARTRLLDAARDVIRRKGFSATTVDDICREAEVTKGAYFHHFESKEAMGVAAAHYWSETTSELFKAAPYQQIEDPLARILGYVDFRKQIIDGELSEFTCLVGTMTQEAYQSHERIRAACADSIFDHVKTLEPDIEQALQNRKMTDVTWTASSLACHIQAVLQGAFILAKASESRDLARDSVTHLRRYIELLFTRP